MKSFFHQKNIREVQKSTFVHPFDDIEVIAGQGTVGLEILNDSETSIDYLFLPVGGGGLASGVGNVFKSLSPATQIIGVEPKGAPSLTTSLQKGKNTTLDEIDKFVDYFDYKSSTLKQFDPLKILRKAEAKGNKLRFVAEFNQGKAKVGLVEATKSDDYYQLDGTDNIVLIYSTRYPEQPMVIKGAGAGAAVTASGVFADIMRLANN